MTPNSTSGNGIVVGLVGSVCAGKSEVAKRLRQLGAEIYEADAIVRWLYDQPEVKEAVRQLFGDSIIDREGAVDRAAIAARVFGPEGDAHLRRRLTDEILFPRTGEVLKKQLAEFRSRAKYDDVLVLDAPTLLEAGRADICDRLIFVTAPLARRRAWAAQRGWPDGEVERRDAALIPESEKRRRADYVIENTGLLDELHEAIGAVWAEIRRDS